MTAKLAILGGTPALSSSPRVDEWPARSASGSRRLLDTYFGGDWSFNTAAEREFEREFAAYHDAKFGVFLANGTAALQCALQSIGVGPGDEVIVPALTWIATAIAPSYCGALPVIVDCDPQTLCLDPGAFERAITPKTKAVIPVHAYSSTADLDRILQIAGRHGVHVIEDCAHAHGGSWRGKGVGSWGRVGAFSFQQSKALAAGEGGMCITNDRDLAERIFMAKHIGYRRPLAGQTQVEPPPPGYLCYNFRATAFQAAILSDQLNGLADRLERYARSARLIADAVADVPGARTQRPGLHAERQGYYTFNVFFDGALFDGIDADTISAATVAEGVGFFPSVHEPVYLHRLFNLPPSRFRVADGKCTVSERLAVRTVGLPHYALYYPDSARQFADVLVKVLSAPDQLRRVQAERQLRGSGPDARRQSDVDT